MAEDPRALPMAAALAPRGSWMRARADETLRGVVARDGLDVPRGGGMDVLPSDVILQGHTGEVYSAAFDPSGETVVTASRDNTARLWDARTGELKGVLEGHTDWVRSAAFDPSGETVVTASRDETARLWDARTGELKGVLEGHTEFVLSAAFDTSGETVVTASDDKTARLWDARTGVCRGVVVLGFALFGVRFGEGTEGAITFSGRNAAVDRCALVVRCEVPADWSVLDGPLSVISRASLGAGMLRCYLRRPN